ncbi:MAG TPA: bifunctional DNA-formamidopyrimidine glycosylase/DNA-(apurinic or apyrimidinic site) lyase [Gammaproteobacteria bacterium]|nr:bifunctional DNA-formamidopyrimidine glycosylase/DNA-(apurinic or apyrimidinic site) lyase [Gammaproteobacteria bacterium]
MPELPEVETTRRGIAPHLEGRRIVRVIVREPRLRWPVDPELPAILEGQTVHAVGRRAKYLLLATDAGTVLLHLGMSGSLRLVPAGTAPGRHDHLDLCLDDGRCLRLNDPRRFGSVHWTGDAPETHRLLAALGPEPLGTAFDGAHLYGLSRGRTAAVKAFLMDSRVVVGVGNIYASEALFRAGIHPRRPAGRVGRGRYLALADAVREVLGEAVAAGGTTLRDFVDSDGRPGYFAQSLRVYGKAGAPCPACGATLRQERIGQRATYYCPRCQR